MNKKYKAVFLALFFIVLLSLLVYFLRSHSLAVLNPKGTIAHKQRHLIVISTLLMLIVVVPVYILTFGIAWRYRESNTKAKYDPNWDHNRALEILWWAIPGVIILALAIITWKSSHELDPFKPLASSVKPINVQVVALQWKWLFIYPEQNIASVNFVQFPTSTPVNFSITADAPMNSFWIPQLGGQIYAMNGMSTHLHLMANESGDYRGSSANISGRGFASMHFIAKASSAAEFNKWVQQVKKSPSSLSQDEYNQLVKPAESPRPLYYASATDGLYDAVLMKFMRPARSTPDLDNRAQNTHVNTLGTL